MSFGFSVSDFITLIDLSRRIYSRCRSAPAEFAEAGRLVESLHTILEGLRHEFESPTSILRQLHREDFITIIKNCKKPVLRLKRMLLKYSNSGTSKLSIWDRVRLPVRELQEIQSSITLQTSTLSAFLNTVGLGSSGRVEEQLQTLNGRVRGVDHKAENGFRDMLEAINTVSAGMRAERKEGTVMTAYSDDETEVWRQFRRELLDEGFASASIKRHQQALKEYIRQLDDQGLLDEASPDERSLPQKDSGNPEDESIYETIPKGLLGEDGNAEGSHQQRTPAAMKVSIAEAEARGRLSADPNDNNTDSQITSDFEGDLLSENQNAEGSQQQHTLAAMKVSITEAEAKRRLSADSNNDDTDGRITSDSEGDLVKASSPDCISQDDLDKRHAPQWRTKWSYRTYPYYPWIDVRVKVKVIE